MASAEKGASAATNEQITAESTIDSPAATAETTASNDPSATDSQVASEKDSSNAGAAEAKAPQTEGKAGKRAQTCRDRREFHKKKRLERSWEQQNGSSEPRESSETSGPRLPKRRVALLIGFCGTGYQGMQINPNAKTIEGDLFKALAEAGAVSADNATDQKKVQLQRAARTDKGVHAAGQVVSLKMIVEDPEIVAKVNSHLPDQIRVWGYVRTIRSFNSKTMCDSRIYEYLLPTYVFMEPSAENAEIAKTVPFEEREVPASSDENMKAKRDYRISPDMLQFVRDAFAKYKGTHDFRNFTVTRGCTASNSKRYIYSFDVSDPKIIQGSEWLSLKVKGQSFMLHQIRKMVGLIILMARSGTPLRLMDELFSGPRVNVPKAPGLGLLLEQPVFDAFNKRVASQQQGSNDPVSFEPHNEEIERFKNKYIYDAIIRSEMAERVFDSWVQSVEVFPEQYTYINKEGVIPESAIVVPGADRNARFASRNKQTDESSDEEDTNDE
ncbi:tRNA pseudouridine synthase 1 [Dipsacomyces acuminosporus]|nr:tRNA pseudouridine synthase 1 [Dipsacomyces acuminosporus]